MGLGSGERVKRCRAKVKLPSLLERRSRRLWALGCDRRRSFEKRVVGRIGWPGWKAKMRGAELGWRHQGANHQAI
jgi:hypothetical protein